MCELKVCRVCLNMDVRGYKMEEHSLRSIYEDVIRRKVNLKDGLPQWFCYECSMMLHKFNKFKEKCIQGQSILKQLLWRGIITYEAVATVDRVSLYLVSPVNIITRNQRVESTMIKYKTNLIPRPMEVEKVMLSLDSEDSMKHDHLIQVNENRNTLENIITDYNETPDSKKGIHEIDITMKTAVPPMETLKVKSFLTKDGVDVDNRIGNAMDDRRDTYNDTGNTIAITDDTSNMNDDIGNTDHIDTTMVSDDENIFLDVVKGTVEDKSYLVCLDDTEMEPKGEKEKKGTENVINEDQKFNRPKKEYLNPKYWKKFNLNEEEAMHDFKQREHSDKFVKAKYKCQNCLKGFSRNEILVRHLRLRHDEVRCLIECRFCHMRFRVQNQLSKHMKQHYIVYHCLRCDRRFRLETTAILHEDYHKGVMKKCKHCGEEFKHTSTYYTHLRMSHRSAHLCTVCGASFVSAIGLEQHRKQKHFDNNEEAPGEAASANTYCEKCDIKFASQAAYDEHLTHSNMHGDLTSNTIVRKFKRIPTTCTHCGQNFPSRQAYKKHHKIEHSQIPFYESLTICEVCGVSLAEANIPTHMVTHTGERPFPCTVCDKRFSQKSGMKMHYKTVHLKQPYPKYPRRKPYIRKKKTDEIPLSDLTAFKRPAFYS